MMKLRTKSQNLSKFAIVDDQTPSTSCSSIVPGMRRCSTNSTNSVDSPDSSVVGRIAKSNARILNGLDLSNGKRAGAYDVLAILPDLKIDEINSDKYPTISKFLKSDVKTLDVETLHLIQHELEELISLNIDCQMTIHGEITYMRTGEYPTIDLTNRPMPKYEMLKRQEQQKLKDRSKHAAESTPAMSLADLGILSSPEDEDAPHILDVPNRFWTWAKEYLRPISTEYMMEFKKKIVDAFDDIHMAKHIQQKVVHSPVHNKHLKRKSDSQHTTQTPIKMAKLSSEQTKSKAKASKGKERMDMDTPISSRIRQNGLMSNGIMDTMCHSKNKNSPKSMETIKNYDDGKIGETNDLTVSSVNADNHEKDEVTLELERKQLQLKQVHGETKPLINKLFVRLLLEYAVQEIFGRLDQADNSLYQLGSKYERLHMFNKEQRQEAEQILRAHIKTYKTYHSQLNGDSSGAGPSKK